MLIGNIAKRSGISRDTIRYYEKRGLLKTKERRDNNYREYGEEDLARLNLVSTMKGCGFTLSELAEILDLVDETGPTCGVTGPKAQAKTAELGRKIAELQRMRVRLKQLFSSCTGTSAEDECTPIAEALRV